MAEKIVKAEAVINAPAHVVFELIADPSKQPLWDGNDNLSKADEGQRVRNVGDAFIMTITNRLQRQNHVVEFEERRLIAWKPSPVGKRQPGHLWRWQLAPLDAHTTRVIHTYDWTGLDDETRVNRARSTTPDWLLASIHRLRDLAEELTKNPQGA